MIDLPPSPGCAWQPDPGKVVRSAAAHGGWGDADELLADEAQAGGFIADPDAGTADECSIFAQDCPGGEKCMPWANDGGGSWNATRCSPISDTPVAVGGACTVEGSGVSGVDDCDLGAMCWGVDTETNMGHCIELCSCSLETPVCETPNTRCQLTNQDVLPLCLPVCNPLDPSSCADGDGCDPVNDLFHCAPDASGSAGAAGDACAFINVCDPGNFCANGSAVPGCASAACCSAFCTIGSDDACLAGQECVPWYAEGTAPDECLAEVGACSVI